MLLVDLDNLLVAARNGSQLALGHLLDAFRPYLNLRARFELGNDLHAKFGDSDLLQETMTAACQAFPQFRGSTEGELQAWLQTILRRQAINAANHFRGAGKRQIDRELSLDDSAIGPRLRDQLVNGGASPSELFVKQEEAEILENALNTLTEDQRRIIELRHRQGLSFSQIASIIERSEEATRKFWARSLEAWQAIVESSYRHA